MSGRSTTELDLAPIDSRMHVIVVIYIPMKSTMFILGCRNSPCRMICFATDVDRGSHPAETAPCSKSRKEGQVLFNDALNSPYFTVIIWRRL